MTRNVHIAGILFATIFGFSFLFSKIALNYVSPIGLIAYRFLIAFIAFEILRLTKVIKIKIQRSQFKYLIYVVLFQPILYFLFETYGLQLVSSGEAGMMIALIPIFVAILSAVIIKEKPKGIQVLFILLSFVGVLFIQLSKIGQEETSQFLGFVLLLFAVISAALFNIASRTASTKSLRPMEVTYFMMLFGALIFNIIYIIQLLIENRVSDFITNLAQFEIIGPILYLGVVASIGGFFLVNLVLSKVPAHVSSIYANLSTIVAIIAGVLLLNESVTIYHVIGSIFIITGVYGTVRFNARSKKNIKAPY
ncbi:DMT family transporter [Mariniplasma anaerobium]|uniref:Permease n=1 Tax=Mariniplasma anaerobium TaxID=2735436 RepID=A0A7U9TGR1_9MOLU|nr:EamA family transporter [Mariniplasma anaerobium]BCR35883.1 permease [Mariniplasma anaerobium]